MVINGASLLKAAPVHNMARTKLYEMGVSFGLGEAGYDIRIKQEIHFGRDLFLRRYVERYDYSNPKEDVYAREYGHFIIASSIERFEMPDNMIGIVHDKSSWARRGLSVFNTVIEPGWKGYLTLELVCHRWKGLTIPAGAGIAQVVFHQVSDPSHYDGRYQNQKNAPVEAIDAIDSRQPTLL